MDIAIIETGLGGRLDSTNVVMPELSIITNIGLDHTDLLGDTLEKLAFEKAGIIKRNVPVVISEHQAEVAHVFQKKAREENAAITFASDTFSVKQLEDLSFQISGNGKVWSERLKLALQGTYQEKNIPGVLKALETLSSQFSISKDKIIAGLERVVENTRLKGRWQKLSDKPLIICDTGHNLDGVKELVKQIQKQTYKNLHIVWGMVKDKDVMPVLSILPKHASYYFCQAKIPRALDAHVLCEKAREVRLSGVVVPDVNEAIASAMSRADKNDFIFIGGSTFVVGEIMDI
ncbi:MAG: hypothetical protein L0Y35_04300 [Flammeovirgaceae bacterium]|nr:hypothetical protein [Flammeovirgaceae bacterium]